MPHSQVLPQLDFSTYPTQIAWAILFFIILYVMIYFIFLPRIVTPIKKRRLKLLHTLRKAQKLRNIASKKREKYLEYQTYLKRVHEKHLDNLLNKHKQRIQEENNNLNINIEKQILKQKKMAQTKLTNYYSGHHDTIIVSLAGDLVTKITKNRADRVILENILKDINKNTVKN